MPRILVVLFLFSLAHAARADLMSDARALVSAWTRPGAVAKRLSPIFLHDGERRRVPLPDVRDAKHPCMTIVAIAERHLRFTITTQQLAQPVESRAGVARITDCERGSLTLPAGKRHVELVMTRGRGAIELIRVVYATQITPVDVIVPERAIGTAGAEVQSAGALRLAPKAARVARARRGAQLDGASTVAPLSLGVTDAGAGSAVVQLVAGCHRLHVIADTGSEGTADVDAEVRNHEDEALLARDRSHAPDARLELCVGTEQRVQLRFSGAPPKTEVVLLDAFWPIPSGVGSAWGARARAGLAWALYRRRTPAPQRAPLWSTLGAAGVTLLPVPVLPNACYLAAFALVRGQAQTSRLSLKLGLQARYDDANDPIRSAAITFCAGGRDEVAQLTFDVRSRDAWWVGAMWRLGDAGAN